MRKAYEELLADSALETGQLRSSLFTLLVLLEDKSLTRDYITQQAQQYCDKFKIKRP